jgi:general secretion pathway protein B
MSYILDALKKLERKRPQEETRPTLTLGEATKPAARPRVPWLTLVAVGLILNAMVLIWWIVFRGPYHPPRSAPPPPRRALVKPAPSAVPSPVTSIARDADRRMTDREQTLTPVGPKGLEDRKASAAPPEKLPVSDPVKTARPADKRPSLLTAPKSPAEQPRPGPPQERLPATVPVITPPPEKKSSAPDRAKEPPPPAAKKEAPRNDRVFNLNELPADVRSALPPLKVSAHVYSPEPQSRLVRVNEQLLQEGQDSTEGLKVVEIMPKGIVFRFQGYRFRMELP